MKLILHLGRVAEVLWLWMCQCLVLMLLLLLLMCFLVLLVMLLRLEMLLRLNRCVKIAHAESSDGVLHTKVNLHVVGALLHVRRWS